MRFGTNLRSATVTQPFRSAVADVANYIHSWLGFQQRYGRIPGIQAAVWHDDELVFSGAYGHADLATRVPLTTQHLFRVASHSKMFTAAAVLQLVERGDLRLDDTVGQWLPFLGAVPLSAVTVRELLTHGGGVIRDGKEGDFWQLAHPFPDEQQLRATLLDQADVLPANDRFKYSNIGYSILGLIIAEASGQPYGDYVREHIVEKLALPNTGPEYDPDRASEYVTGYTALSYADRRLPIDHIGTGAMASATGFYSTAEELVTYGAAQFPSDTRILSDTSKRQMQRVDWQVDCGAADYGMGYEIVQVGARRLFGHGGGFPGQTSRTLIDPDRRLAVSVLTSAIDGPALRLATSLVRLVDLAAGTRPDPVAAQIDRTRLIGRFAHIWRVVDVTELGGRLYLLDPAAPDPAEAPADLSAMDAQTLRIEGGNQYDALGETIRYTFVDGSVETVRIGPSTYHPIERVSAAAGALDRVTIGRPLH